MPLFFVYFLSISLPTYRSDRAYSYGEEKSVIMASVITTAVRILRHGAGATPNRER